MLSKQEKTNTSYIWVSVLESLPSSPGVYWFIGEGGEVLYVGKAKNLKKRVSSYARVAHDSEKIAKLVSQASRLKFHELRSELEALFVEAELIRIHQPHYNSLLKDDKSPLYIVLTKEEFPRVITARKKELLRVKTPGAIFGPFPSGYTVRQVLHLIRPIFRWCNEKVKNGRPCLYHHLGLCLGPCAGAVSKEQYDEMISHLKLFLRGKTGDLMKELKAEMDLAAQSHRYEEAGVYRDRMQMIQEIAKRKHVFGPDLELPQLQRVRQKEMLVRLKRLLIKHIPIPNEYELQRIEGYDISNIAGKSPTASMVVFTDGRQDLSEYRYFHIRSIQKPNDTKMLQETLLRRQYHREWSMPNLVIIDGGKGQLRAVLRVWRNTVPVVSIAKKPDRLILFNSTNETFTEVLLDGRDPGAQLVQQIRDESHRFARKLHHKASTARMLES